MNNRAAAANYLNTDSTLVEEERRLSPGAGDAMPQCEPVIRLGELSRSDVPLAGGKGANLGEMMRAGLPVPDGFVVTTVAFLAALDAVGVRDDLRTLFARVDADDASALAKASAEMQTPHAATSSRT